MNLPVLGNRDTVFIANFPLIYEPFGWCVLQRLLWVIYLFSLNCSKRLVIVHNPWESCQGFVLSCVCVFVFDRISYLNEVEDGF